MALKRDGSKFERILEAAVKVFAKKGFFNARINDIARESRVADGTIYLYFKGKDDILIHIFEVNLARLMLKCVEGLGQLRGALKKLEYLFKFQLEFLISNRDLAEVLIVETRQSHKFMKEYTPKKFLEYLDIIKCIIEEGKSERVFNGSVDSDMIKCSIFGTIEEIALNWIFSRKEKDLEKAINGFYHVLLNGIMDPKANSINLKNS